MEFPGCGTQQSKGRENFAEAWKNQFSCEKERAVKSKLFVPTIIGSDPHRLFPNYDLLPLSLNVGVLDIPQHIWE